MKLTIAMAIANIAVPPVASATVETNPRECIDPADYPADTDFFPEKFVPDETTDLLTVEYHDTYKIVTNKHVDKSYLLYQCGTEPPADEVESGKHHLVVSVPHEGGVAVTETPQIPPMELLGLRPEVKAYIGNPKLVSSPCLNHLRDEGSVATLFFEDDEWPYPKLEEAKGAFVAERPEMIVLAGPYGDVDDDMHMGVAASQEKTAVATFDWLGMFAALYNMEGTANKIISDTQSRYQCSAANAKVLSSGVQDDAKPEILWAQYFDPQGWSVASCPTWDSAYYCEFAHHCGAKLVSRPEGVGTSESYDGGKTLYWYLSDEEMLELGKDVETWIYPSKTFEAIYNKKKDMLDQFKSVQNKQVYDTQGQGPYGWHEQRLAEYDVVALDFCTLVGTENPDTVHRRRWFRSYYSEPMGSPGTCDVPSEVAEPYVPAQATCTVLSMENTSTYASSGQTSGNSFHPILLLSLLYLLV